MAFLCCNASNASLATHAFNCIIVHRFTFILPSVEDVAYSVVSCIRLNCCSHSVTDYGSELSMGSALTEVLSRYDTTWPNYNPLQLPLAATLPKPAALHLYPHIHGSKASTADSATYAGAAQVAARSGLSATQYKSILHPQLYKLHNNPLQQSHIYKQLDKVRPLVLTNDCYSLSFLVVWSVAIFL